MHLRRLELQGFKSFAGRTDVELEPGTTAVVGPNGAGKSNLAEALRWALGEQSARQLRGSRMEDVIFHGSDSRRPVGMAEVALTFDNVDGRLPLDFSEVMLVRRVYRSGESEYLINRAAARLRDVQDLLALTGVGRDGYAIMEQNRVDELLRARPEDRRALFEEAAGITRHRQRKREALRKLDETTLSLARVSDVIAELGSQLEPLQEQATAAREYLGCRNERDRLEQALRARGLARLSRQWTALEEKKAALGVDLGVCRDRLTALEGEREAGRLRLEELGRALAAREQTVAGLAADLQKVETDRQLSRERQRHLLAEADRLAGEVAEAQRLRDEEENRVRRLEAEAALLTEEMTRLAAERDRLEADRSGGASRLLEGQARLEELRGSLIDRLNRLGEARHAATRAQEEQDRLLAARADHRRRQAGLAEEVRTLTGWLRGVEGGTSEVSTKIGARRSDLAVVQDELPAVGRALEDARRRLAELKERLAGEEARLATLRDLEQAGEGFPAGVRALLAGSRPGVIGPLADYVAPASEESRALAAALDTHAGCLLVERDRLPDLIAYLREGNRGRATLWPVPLPVAGPAAPPGPTLAPAAGGPAGEVLRRLLEGVLVAPDLEAALTLASARGHRYRVVTLEGEVVHPGGGVSVGGVEAGPVGRRADIDRLERRAGEWAAAAQQAEEAVGGLERAAAALREEQTAFQGELGRLQAEAAGLERQAQDLRARLKRQEEEAESLALEGERLAAELELAQRALPALLGEVATHSEQLEAVRGEIQQLEAELRQDRRDEEERGRRLAEVGAELARAEAKAAGGAEALTEARAALAVLTAEHESRARRLADVHEQGRAREGEAAVREEEAARLAAELEVQREQGRIAREEREALARSLAGQELEVARLRGDAEALRERFHELEIKAARLEVEYGNLARAGPADDASADLGGLSESQARERVAELGALMAAMGEVNLGAVAEFDRLGERCRFLERERSDLEEARRDLDRLLAEIDQVMAERFLEGFNAIGDAFAEIFSDLFGGGRGELILEDPQDPLETGVEIRAQPPGKRLQNLSLLSAGERALTAIALLFAILTVRPAPFCILDEIDAPLDDVNTAKFARMLKQYSARTQFLVVTHNKGTMEVADALYGVTMEEGGVSRLVSVRLAEAVRAVEAGEGG
ncbi:MAG: chromosome segregation protein SMC [bacterium]|nr:chromosome segregation protein SMC [bacterium]